MLIQFCVVAQKERQNSNIKDLALKMAETVGVMSLWPGQEKVRGEKAGPQVLLCSLSGRARIDEEWSTPGDIYTMYLFHKLK